MALSGSALADPDPAPTAQGDLLLGWGIWAVTAAVVFVTYSRLAPEETYHVSREGFVGGLSRTLTLVNYPIALVAIAMVLAAVTVLPRAAWWLAVPSIALCASIPWFVDQDDLDARWANAIPATGVLLALGLTAAAARRAGTAAAPPRAYDRWRARLAVAVALLSLPWITAELGFHFPGDVFMGEELRREPDGTHLSAVHLGHHHGTDGALLVLTGLLLSRVRIRKSRLGLAFTAYVGLMLAYGGVNFVQDAWNEQIVKRGWSEARIPSAIIPSASPIWVVVVVVAVLFAFVLLREDERRSYSEP